MNKEKLLLNKKEVAERELSYTGLYHILPCEILQKFSIPQIKIICELLKDARKEIANQNPFVTLSATEVLHKQTGMIAEFTLWGIREEPETEILKGAARYIYKKWKQKNKNIK